MTQPAVRACGLGYHYATRQTPAFSSIDLVVGRGERILLTGNSGSGKSTLLSVIAGLASDGEEGRHIGTVDVNGVVGMVMQDPEAQTILSRVGDDVAFGAENLGVAHEEIWPRVRRALDAVGLEVDLDHNTAHLSGGQKQRLAIAGVIAMGADIIILDEPTANLDPDGRRVVIEAVDRVCATTGATLIVVEHRPAQWVGVVDSYYRVERCGLTEISVAELPAPPVLPPAQVVPASTELAVEATHLRPTWGPARSVAIPRGHSTIMTGRNGSGKTTLALALAGLSRPVQGRVRYSQRVAQGLTAASYAWSPRQLSSRIGYVFQEPEHQFVASTVLKEMTLSGAEPKRVNALCERMRLDHVLQANPFTLSGGEKRRLSVATALVNAPSLVFLDEPTFGQDDQTFAELVGLIRELTHSGVTVVSITHDELFMASLGDHQEVLE